MTDKLVRKLKKEFNKKFTVKGEGKVFFDIVEWKTKDYIKSRPPFPKELWNWIDQALKDQRKEMIKNILPKFEIIKSNIDASQDFVHNPQSKRMIKEVIEYLKK